MSDVIGSAEFELRATKKKLKDDLRDAQKEVKQAADQMRRDSAFATDAMRKAFRESGQSEFQRSMHVLRNASTHTNKEVRDAADRLAGDLRGRYRDLGRDIGNSLRAGSQVAQVAFLGISGYGIKLAAEAAEIENAFDVAFKGATSDARDFSEALADTAGRDAVALRESMSRLQLVITGTGVEAGKAAEMVKAMTARAVDVGSLFNVSDAEALASMISGITGETEPLKKFGVVINEAAVQAKLLEMGFKGNAAEASEAAKAIARAQLILEKTSVAQGDAAKTADSAANSAKRMKAEFDKAARQLGEQLLPAATAAAGGLTELLKAFNEMPDGVQIAGLAILGLIAAGGPIAGLLTNLSKVIKLARETRLAMMMIAGGGAAAGLGTTALGVAATAAPYAAPAVAGAISVKNDTDYKRIIGDLDSATDDELAAARRWADARVKNYERLDGGLAIQKPGIANETWARLTRERGDIDTAMLGRVTAEMPTGADASVATGFDLNGVDPGGDKKPKKASGPTPEQLALRREEIQLQTQMEVARAANDQDAIRALEVKADLVNRIQAYDAAGLTTADARKAAEADMAVIAKARAQAQEQAVKDQQLMLSMTIAEAEQHYNEVEALRRAAEKADLIRQYQQMGFDLLTAQVKAGQDLLRIDQARAKEKQRVLALAQAEHDLELARIRGDSERQIRAKERGVELDRRAGDIAAREGISLTEARAKAGAELDQEEEARLQGQFRDVFKGGFRAALDKDLGNFARQWLADAASRGLEDALNSIADAVWALFKQAFSQGAPGATDGGNWLSAIGKGFTSLFGGARAYGGGVEAGKSYLVGERGQPEIFTPGVSGMIMPTPKLGMAGAGASAGRGSVLVRVTSDDPKFKAYVEGISGRVAADGDAQVVGASLADRQRSARKQQYRARR